jgi:hypothetical protein
LYYNSFLTTTSTGCGFGFGIAELCQNTIMDLGLVGAAKGGETSYGSFSLYNYNDGIICFSHDSFNSVRVLSSRYENDELLSSTYRSAWMRQVHNGESERFINNPINYCHGIQHIKYINYEFCYILSPSNIDNSSLGCLISLKDIGRNNSTVKVHNGYAGLPFARHSLENNQLYILERDLIFDEYYLLKKVSNYV